MGNESPDKPINPSAGWLLVLVLSSALEHREREAVLGDLAESGDSPDKAFADVLGLVIHRQAPVLLDWRLWVAAAFVLVPLAFLLSFLAQNVAGDGAVYSWMYLNNWDWTLTRYPGFWYVLRETAIEFGVSCLLLACCSWSAGFVMGRLPRAILCASSIGLILLIALSQLTNAPHLFMMFCMRFYGLPGPPPLPDTHAPITAIGFYRVVFPWIFLAGLVLLPVISGMRQARRTSTLDWRLRVVLVIVAAASLLTMLVQLPGFGLLLRAPGREWLWYNRNTLQTLSRMAWWPMLYMIAMGFRRYRRHRPATA